MTHTVLIFRTQCAAREIEAPTAKEARRIMKQMIDNADDIDDLGLSWEQDGGITIDTVAVGSGDSFNSIR